MNCWWVAAFSADVGESLLGRWLLDGSFLAPSLQVAAVDVYEPERSNSAAPAGRFRVAHATTPINRTSMYYFWVVARDFGASTDEMATLEALTKRGFAEDEAMIEAVQDVISTDPRGAGAPEIGVKADSAAIHARRIVGRWMARET